MSLGYFYDPTRAYESLWSVMGFALSEIPLIGFLLAPRGEWPSASCCKDEPLGSPELAGSLDPISL